MPKHLQAQIYLLRKKTYSLQERMRLYQFGQ